VACDRCCSSISSACATCTASNRAGSLQWLWLPVQHMHVCLYWLTRCSPLLSLACPAPCPVRPAEGQELSLCHPLG